MTSLPVKSQYTALRTGLGLSRSFGPVDLSWHGSFTKFINGEPIKKKHSLNRRDLTKAMIEDPSLLDIDADGTVQQDMTTEGTPNTSMLITNSLSIGYNISEDLSISYSVGFLNSFKYAMPDDEYTQVVNTIPGTGRIDMMSPTLDVTYNLSSGLADVVELPCSLGLSTGISALHPARQADNQGFFTPFFFDTFGENRAANGFGSSYFDLVGSF